MVAPILDAVARAADPDGDGVIQAADYTRLFTCLGHDSGVVTAAFRVLDADADSRISTSEFRDALDQLLMSHDSADPGTGMLGYS